MNLSPGVRKLALTAHVSASVGWLGAVAGFLALAGLTSPDGLKARAAYLSMDVTTQFVIVPLCLAALATGLIQSLGTRWGLFRHYWVLAKLLMTLFATIILLLHTRAIRSMAEAAVHATLAPGDFRPLRIQLAADAGAALLVLLVVTALAVYKPRGLTRYGWRKQQEKRRSAGLPKSPAVS